MRHEKRTIRIGARGSKLSRAQANTIQTALQDSWPDIQFVTHIIETTGDRDQKSPLPEIGGKGLFTAELEEALKNGTIDLAVHSQKDLPIKNPPGLCLGAIYPRDSHLDALVSHQGYTLETLPLNAPIGTSSARRKAQLLALRPDLEVLNLRGNVDTRLRKSIDFDAIVLAHAGLVRLGLESHVTQIISEKIMLPAPAQGALAVQCRDEPEFLRLLDPIHHADTADCTLAERSFLEGLGGGCSLPISALARKHNGIITLEGQVISPDGKSQIREIMTGQDSKILGGTLAQLALSKGARELIGG